MFLSLSGGKPRHSSTDGVCSQGETIYHEAQQELSAVSQDATRGFTDLRQTIINRTRSLSLNTSPPADAGSSSQDTGDQTTPTRAKALSSEEALAESESVLTRLKEEAAKRLKDLQKAEDAADEALLRFGSNLRDFFRDAIQIAPPTNDQGDNQGNTVLFESKDAAGKRVIHTSRFDAQLHVIHTTTDNFIKDGTGAEYETWAKEFDVDKKTENIAADLAKYPELRTTMEKLVPDTVPYADFWKRYYFLRHGIETAEARRRDLLKGKIMSSPVHLETCTYANMNQLPRLKRKLAGTRTLPKKKKRRRIPARRSPVMRRSRPPPNPPLPNLCLLLRPSALVLQTLPPRSTLLPLLPSRQSLASLTTGNRWRIVTPATMLSAPRLVYPVRRPTVPRTRRSSMTVMAVMRRIGSRKPDWESAFERCHSRKHG